MNEKSSALLLAPVLLRSVTTFPEKMRRLLSCKPGVRG